MIQTLKSGVWSRLLYVSKYELKAGTQARVKSRQTILPGSWERRVDVSRLGA